MIPEMRVCLNNIMGRGDSSVVERRAGDRKAADLWFDSRTGNASLYPWERHFTPVSHWAKQSTSCGDST